MPPQAAARLSAPPVAFEPPPPVSRDRLTVALADVDPGSRALLDLSVRWQVADERVARLLATDADDIARRRAGVMEGVAGALGVDPLHGLDELRAALADLPAEAWGVPVPASARAVTEPPAPRGAGKPVEAPRPAWESSVNLVAEPVRAAFAEARPAVRRQLPVLSRPSGRTMLAVAVGAVLGAVLGRRRR